MPDWRSRSAFAAREGLERGQRGRDPGQQPGAAGGAVAGIEGRLRLDWFWAGTNGSQWAGKNQPEDALTYMKIALDCAKQTKDVFYIVSAALAIGDFHYDRKQSEIALKHYIYALDFAQNKLSADNLNKINVRINDIKFKIGVENFDKLVEIIREQKEE